MNKLTHQNLFGYLMILLSCGLLLAANNKKPEYAPIAILELFTSQGCSSCPSADRLLTETLRNAAKANQNVIGLSFHVDYWNRLGWKDPFSDRAYTRRQYAYGERFGLKGAYTPQEVLNGQYEFVGSNRARQQQLIREALSRPATVGVVVQAKQISDKTFSVHYQLDGSLTGAVLNLALVSKSAETAVARGENAGRKLTGNNIVRVFQTVPAEPKGVISLPIPADFDASNGALIAYVQDQKSLVVRGGTQRNL